MFTTRELAINDLHPNLLRCFNRYQKVQRCWRMENGKWTLKDISFIDQWDVVKTLPFFTDAYVCESSKRGGDNMDVSKMDKGAFLFPNNIQLRSRHATENTQSIKPQGAVTIDSDYAVKVEISTEGRLAALEMKKFDPSTSFLKLDQSILSQEAREQRNAVLNTAMPGPFDNEFQILGVQYTFQVGTLESFISNALDGKARNASLVASELGQMIRSVAYNNGNTVEERASKREMGMKHAEYIAQNYFDNPDEAKAFLDGIRGFYDNDILREKGYVVIEGTDMASFRSYISPHDGNISMNEFAKKFGASDIRDIISSPEKSKTFLVALNGNRNKWSGDIIKAFEENALKIADIINLVRGSLSENDVNNSLQRILKAF